jgi:hypothetical protein
MTHRVLMTDNERAVWNAARWPPVTNAEASRMWFRYLPAWVAPRGADDLKRQSR